MQNLGTFSIDVILQDNRKFDIYLSHEGSSGEHHKDVDLNDIGTLTADLVEAVAVESLS